MQPILMESDTDIPVQVWTQEHVAAQKPVRFKLEWSVDNISEPEQLDSLGTIHSNAILLSDLGFKDCTGRWRLDLNFCSKDEESKQADEKYLSVHLSLLDEAQEIFAKFKFSLRRGLSAIVEQNWLTDPKAYPFGKNGDTWGYDTFCRREDIFVRRRNCALSGDAITITADVIMYRQQTRLEPVHISRGIPLGSSSASVDGVVVQPQEIAAQHSSRLNRAMQRQLQFLKSSAHEHGSNFCLESSDGVTFHADRFVLMAHSPVFAAMLSHGTVEKSSGRCRVPDVEGETMTVLLEFFYGCEYGKVCSDNAEKVLAAADKYQVVDLRSVCEGILAASVSITNAAHYLVVADQRRLDTLMQAVLSFINSGNMALVFAGDAIQEVFQHNSTLLQKVMEHCAGSGSSQ